MEKYILTIARNSKISKFQKIYYVVLEKKKDYFNKNYSFTYPNLKEKIKKVPNRSVMVQ